MKTILDDGIVAVTMLMMVTVGMDLEAADFAAVARRKGVLAWMLLFPAVLLPPLGFMLAQILGLPPHLAAGLLLLAACPVGDIANFYTLLAGGSLALSVTVNTMSCLLSVATMAAAFGLYDRALGQHYPFAVPTPVLILRFTLMIALPVVAGMALRHWRPAWVAARRKIMRALCLAGIAFFVVYFLVNRWTQVAAGWRQTALAGMAFMSAALAAGLVLARFLRLDSRDSITVGILFSVRNVALAIAIAIAILNRTEFAEVAVVYFLAEVPLLLAVVGVYRRCWATPPARTRPADART